MSNEEDDENYSDYNDDSFDNESVSEEVSEHESASSSLSTEDVLPEVVDTKSSTGSLDKLSFEEEENDLSSLNLDEDDNAISELLKKAKEDQRKVSVNEHEIDESDTENEDESAIAENIKSLCVAVEKDNNSEPVNPISDELTVKCIVEEALESCEKETNESHIEFDIRSETPTSFNSEDHAFHVEILKQHDRYIAGKRQIEKKSRNSNRKSLSFSNERMREIERHNHILLRKILTQKPRKETYSTPSPRASSSAVNRKKQQRQIDMDNQVLKRKLEAIAGRRKSSFL